MTIKQFKYVRIAVVILLAIGVSQAITFRQYYLAVAGMAVAMAVLTLLRRRVKEVLADERDYEIAGKAARAAMQIFSWIAVLAMFYFLAYQDVNPLYGPISQIIAYSICGLLLLYNALFYFYNRRAK